MLVVERCPDVRREHFIKGIPKSDLGDHVWKNGTLRIQRRWVENSLPDHELLDAVATAYGRIAQVVEDAHLQLGIEAPVHSQH